jgi:hypothetical protein
MTGVSVEVPRYKNVAQTTGPPNIAISRRETGSTTGPGDILSYNIGVEDTILAMARASTVHYKRRLHCHVMTHQLTTREYITSRIIIIYLLKPTSKSFRD